MTRLALAAALFALGLTASVQSAQSQTPPAALSAADGHDVSRSVAYLQGLTNAEGRFVQTDGRGGQTAGTFHLQRPGRARFDYDPPSGLVVACDNGMVAVLDRRLKTLHTYPLNQTPLALFLAREIRLDRGVVVREVRHDVGAMTLVAEDGRGKLKGRIALTFTESPIRLTGWTLTDARGGVVTVRLANFARSAPRDTDFFRLQDPHRSATPEPEVGR